MRTIASPLLLAAAVVSVAAAPSTATADTVPFSSLPQAQSPVKPAPSSSSAPEKIAAGERVDGIYPAILPEAKRKTGESDGWRTVQVFTSEKDAQAYATQGTLPSSNLPAGASTRICLTRGGTLAPRVQFYYRASQPKPSPEQIQTMMRLHRWPPKPEPLPKKDSVEFVRLERLSQTGDSVAIETVDAFIDLQTMGVRAVSRSSEKLGKVATGPNGLGVFAARENETSSEFLVTNPELPPAATEEEHEAEVRSLQSTATRLVAQLPSGSSATQGCGYTRFTLAAKPGSGQMATVLAMAFLPPAKDPDAPPDPDPSTEDEAEKAQRVALARANRTQRARPVAVNVSLSQLASEQAPLLSVTFGWAGKDQRLSF